MDEFIKEFIFGVTIGILFITIVDMILPENNTKKYINMVCGLILMLLIFSPILQFFNKNSRDVFEVNINSVSDELFSLNDKDESYANYFFNEYYYKNQNSN